MKHRIYKNYYDELLEEISTNKFLLKPNFFDILIIHFIDSLLNFKQNLENLELSNTISKVIYPFWFLIVILYLIIAFSHAIYANIAKVLFAKIFAFRANKPLRTITVGSNFSLLKLATFFYPRNTVNQVFNPLMADWQEESYEALSKKEIWKARWINVRYTYAFLAAMWQKSPIGDLIEFVSKLAK